jgi:hypothetical protein
MEQVIQNFDNLFDFSSLQLDSVWQTYVTSKFSDFVVIAFGTFIIHELTWFFFNLPYILLDEFRILQRYKINPESKVSSETRWRAFRELLKGHFLQLLPLLVLAYPLLSFVGFSSTIPLPTL